MGVPGPRVSVVVTVWNPDPAFFPEAIRSILGQTFTDFELLILDDPGPRSAREQLANIHDARIRFISYPNRVHLVEKAQRGIVEARAELIARLDADDLMEPDRLAKQVTFLDSHPEVAVLGSQLRLIDEKGQELGYRVYPTTHAAIRKTLPRWNAIAQPAVMFRKAPALAAGGYFGPDFVEDFDLWSRMAVRGEGFANLPEARTRYRIHGDASKSTRLRHVLTETQNIKKRHFGAEMGVIDRLRLFAERMMLWLPAAWVVRLFLWTQVKRSLPKYPT